MKKVLVGIGGLLLIAGIGIAIRLAAPKAIADIERGLSPFAALPLNEGRNTGVLAPGESRWYEITPNLDGAYQRQADLTLFFTPDDGGRTHHVNFQIFSANQVTDWYWGNGGHGPNLGAGGVVSRDGNPVTGELLWSGWTMSNDTYYIQVYNSTDVTIDYWLFTDDIIAADLGPANDPPPATEASAEISTQHDQAPPLYSDETDKIDTEPLLPLASELGTDHVAVPPETWDVPAGRPTRLVIPAIALDSPVVPVDQTPLVIGDRVYGQWNTADNSVGWHNRSAKLGQLGNTVLNGHSDLNAAVFRHLGHVDIGDKISVFSGDQLRNYIAIHKFLVKEEDVSLEERILNASWIASTQDERLTLVTCANPGATHRLILIALPLDGIMPQ